MLNLKLPGKKTYIVTIAGIVFAIAGLISGQLTMEAAIPLILAALGLSSLRAGMSKA